jgi:O-antigen ligase
MGLALLCACAAATWMSLKFNPLLVFGGIYASIFSVICWRWPAKAQILIVGFAPFQQDLGGGPVKFSLTEINLGIYSGILIVRALIRDRQFVFGPVFVPVVVYLMFCGLSAFRDALEVSAIVSIAQMGLYMILGVSAFASNTASPRDHLPGLWMFVVVCALLGLTVMGLGSPQKIGLHKNGIGASMGAAFPIAIELLFIERRPVQRIALMMLVALLSLSLLVSLSRGAWMAATVGTILIVGFRKRWDLLLKLGLFVGPVMAVAWSFLPEEDRSYAFGFGSERQNIALRYESIDYAVNLFMQSPFIGLGVGLRKHYDATNVLLLTLAETGVLGFSAFIAIHVTMFGWQAAAYRQMKFDPITRSLIAISAALLVGRLIHGCVDHYWSRGAISVAWTSLGMAAGSVLVSRSRMRRLVGESAA